MYNAYILHIILSIILTQYTYHSKPFCHDTLTSYRTAYKKASESHSDALQRNVFTQLYYIIANCSINLSNKSYTGCFCLIVKVPSVKASITSLTGT